jgi:glutamyl-tRNA synthetase
LYHYSVRWLLRRQRAYVCFCTDSDRQRRHTSTSVHGYDGHCRSLAHSETCERIARQMPFVVRFRTDETRAPTMVVDDAVFGRVTFPSTTVDDFVLLKSDGFPTYHLASVVDDQDMRVSHVIRGEEWLPSTPKHVCLYEALHGTMPAWVHVPLLLTSDRRKLSKREGSAEAALFEAHGILPEALLNFVAFLGWTPSSPPAAAGVDEVLTVKQMTDAFRLSDLNASPAVVSLDRLQWLNGQHLRRVCRRAMDGDKDAAAQVDTIVGRVCGQRQGLGVDKDECVAPTYVRNALYLMCDRITSLNEVSQADYLFVNPWNGVSPLPLALHAPSMDRCAQVTLMASLSNAIMSMPSFDKPSLDALVRLAMQACRGMVPEVRVSYKETMLVCRWALMGCLVGPSVLDTALLLGRERVVQRLRDYQRHVETTEKERNECHGSQSR